MRPSAMNTETNAPLLGRPALAGLVAGVLIMAATWLLPPPEGLPQAGWQTLGLALAMAVWWSTEPVPIGVTALAPLIVLPLSGVSDIAAAAAPYANPLVFLFMGGFLLAAGVSRWDLHQRMATEVVRIIGDAPGRLVLGFMVATGFLSMWISNTAAVVLMLPVASSVVSSVEEGGHAVEDVRRFALALFLGLAYAASIGGMGTLIGTPPNALMAGYLWDRHGIDLSFAAWMAVAMPMVAIFLPAAWFVLTRVVYPVSAETACGISGGHLPEGLKPGEPLTPPQRRVAMVFAIAAGCWIARPVLNSLPGLEGLSDAGIALACGAALFLIPSGSSIQRRFLMTWREAQEIPWQVLILFGGGLSLASAMDSSGLASWIGEMLAGLGGLSPLVFLLLVTTTVVLLTELASNTATVAALLPVVSTIAAGADMDIIVVAAAVAMAASCAFMLPVATPPNALVFASGHVTVAEMIRAGALMNMLSVALVSAAALLLAPVFRFPQ